MSQQHAHARKLIKVIRDRIAAGGEPIHGYGTAAELIGLRGETHARTFGQVCSRIDAASFYSGWPMLALHMVRSLGGQLNPESIHDADWAAWNDEIAATATSHLWSVEQVAEVIGSLDSLPEDGATVLWQHILRREAEKPGFIRWNLHRKITAATRKTANPD